MRIFVAENYYSIRYTLERFLRGRGYEVLALEQLKGQHNRIVSFGPDLILADLKLQNNDTTHYLRELEKVLPAQIGCIIMSGDNAVYVSHQMRELNFKQIRFMQKPFDFPFLQNLINECVPLYRAPLQAVG